MVVWVLWNNRNNKVWNDMADTGRSLGVKVRHLWEEWTVVQQLQHTPVNSSQVQQVLRWQRPSQEWYKCNVDAAFHQEINKTSISWCLRDYLGRFVMAETTWFEGNCPVIEGEAIALIEALKAMQLRNIQQVQFETDSKIVADAILHQHGGFSKFCLLIRHISNLLLSNANFSVKFIKRQVNMVTHTLARVPISWPSHYIFDSLPICISSLLINEMV
jgi:hypothetical protein